jgi:hypothetical protein
MWKSTLYAGTGTGEKPLASMGSTGTPPLCGDSLEIASAHFFLCKNDTIYYIIVHWNGGKYPLFNFAPKERKRKSWGLAGSLQWWCCTRYDHAIAEIGTGICVHYLNHQGQPKFVNLNIKLT